MAAPSLVQAGTGNLWQSGVSVSIALAGVTVGNLIVAHVLEDAAAGTPGFTAITNIENLAGTDSAVTDVTTNSPVGSPEAATQRISLGRALTSAPSLNMSSSGPDLYGRLYEFANVSAGTTLATVIENSTAGSFANGVGTSATIADTAVTTLGVDRLALNFIGVDDDDQASFDTEAFTGQTGGTWVSGGSYGSATGTDGSIGLQYATMATAGTINGGTLTIPSDNWGVVGFALIGDTVTTRVPRSPGVDSGNAHLCKAWQAARRWRHNHGGILVPETVFAH